MERSVFIAMIIATRMEAEPFIEAMEMKEVEVRPFHVYMADDACLAISGIGKANAAMATLYTSLKFDPAWILNLGAAGATKDSIKLGRIYNIESTIEPDRLHLRTNTPYVLYPECLQGFNKAVLATQDSAVADGDSFREIAALADLVDMEGASVVQACQRVGKKCLLFKFVSDTPCHAGRPEIIDHIKDFRGPFCDFICTSVIPIIRNQ